MPKSHLLGKKNTDGRTRTDGRTDTIHTSLSLTLSVLREHNSPSGKNSFWIFHFKIWKMQRITDENTIKIIFYGCMPAAGGKFWEIAVRNLIFALKINVFRYIPSLQIQKNSRPAAGKSDAKGPPFTCLPTYWNRPPLFSNPIITRGGDFHKGGRYS